ncbi:hypothetical protein [Kamptonema sp. UHCC 0994]|nr:hypothetical protein [Kamptonema sp. UHCC 0994]MDF0555224.1 hypothetical protein [Kamptonema sp. UHCC 0994]
MAFKENVGFSSVPLITSKKAGVMTDILSPYVYDRVGVSTGIAKD